MVGFWIFVVNFWIFLVQTSGGLAVSAYWLLPDILNLFGHTLGQLSLILSFISFSANLFIVVVDCWWWLKLLPKTIKLFAGHGRSLGQDANGRDPEVKKMI